MTYNKIQEMLWYLPDEPGVLTRRSSSVDLYGIHDLPDIYKYAEAYRDISFGWSFARKMTLAGQTLPSIFDLQDLPIYRAYWYLRGKTDPLMRTVVSIGRMPEFEMERVAINSYLILICGKYLTEDEGLKILQDKLSLHPKVIYGYEKLFFNVLDRKDDDKFIRGIIYPKSRLVETNEGYLQNEGVEQLMIRAAYNHGERYLDHMMGSRDAFAGQDDAKGFAEKLEATLMANGMFLAHTGFLSSDTPSLRHARGLLTAAKAGGVDNSGDNTLKAAGELLYEEMKHLQGHSMKPYLESQIETVVPV